MNIFRKSNPLADRESPPLIAYLLYALLSIISIYATAESIISNFNTVPNFFAYLIALAIIALIALAIKVIKTGIDSRKIGLGLAGIGFLLLVWGFSLLTNTHKFFLMNNFENIVKDDRESISFELNNLLSRPKSIGQGIITDYVNNGDQLITDFDEEMTNEERPCYAEEAEKKHRKVESFLKEAVEVNSFIKRYPKTRDGCRKASNAIVSNMKSMLRTKSNSMETKLSQIEECEGFDKMEQLIKDIENVSTDEVDYYLDQGHNSYKKVCSCAKSILINELRADPNNFDCLGLSKERWSREIKTIDKLVPFVFKKNDNGQRINSKYVSSFFYNLMIALIVDLGAIFVLYRWIFNKEN